MSIKTLVVTLLTAAVAVTAGACAGRPIEPPSTVAPTATATSQPTATPQPSATAEESAAAALTEEGWSYMQWLAGLHGKFQDASEGLIDYWQASEAEGPGQVAAETIEEMDGLAGAMEDYAQEVQAREDVPEGVVAIHDALLDEVEHWETAAPLLVAGVEALQEGDEAAFQERSEKAVGEIQAAIDAREELLAEANKLLEALQKEEGS